MHMHTHTCTCTCTCTHAHMHTCTHARMHMHMHTCTCTAPAGGEGSPLTNGVYAISNVTSPPPNENCQLSDVTSPSPNETGQMQARCKMQFDAGRRPASRCTMQASQAALSLHLDAASASCVPWNAIWAAADRKIFPGRGRATPAGCARCCAHAALRTASRAAHASGIFYHFLITREGGGTVLISWSGSNTSK